MTGESVKDFLGLFIGAIILLLGLVFIPEIRMKRRWIPVSILIILQVWLGWDKLQRDDRKAVYNTQQSMAANKTIISLKDAMKEFQDSMNKQNNSINEFLRKLEKQENIKRDSVTNAPVIYNTSINNAKNVHIGPGK